jgi:hypothetical protein
MLQGRIRGGSAAGTFAGGGLKTLAIEAVGERAA